MQKRVPGFWVVDGTMIYGGEELPLASWIDDITPYNPVSGDLINFGFYYEY